MAHFMKFPVILNDRRTVNRLVNIDLVASVVEVGVPSTVVGPDKEPVMKTVAGLTSVVGVIPVDLSIEDAETRLLGTGTEASNTAMSGFISPPSIV